MLDCRSMKAAYTLALAGALFALPQVALAQALTPQAALAQHPEIDQLVATHARAHAVPEALVHRVIRRESGYRPEVVHLGNIGLMQIKLGTARSLGFVGTRGRAARSRNQSSIRHQVSCRRVSGRQWRSPSGNPLLRGRLSLSCKRPGRTHRDRSDRSRAAAAQPAYRIGGRILATRSSGERPRAGYASYE